MSSKTSIAAALVAGASFSILAAPAKDVVQSFVKATKSDSAASAKAQAIQSRVLVVFVPGIMGSKLSSPTLGPIWGSGSPDQKKLALPAALVDENAPSDVEATLLDSFVVDQYGKAFSAVKAAAEFAGATALACGYDWRRDLRSGAAEVERCIQKKTGTDKYVLVLIAHSMGGIVTSIWNARHDAGKYSSQHIVGGVALLASPLQGSCEILRMLQVGYQQPVDNRKNIGKRPPNLAEGEDILTALLNPLTGIASKPVRSALLTWPGAFQLAPKMTKLDTEGRSCVPVRAADGGGPQLVSFFEPPFWTTVSGKDLLRGAQPPEHFDRVLAQAREFRNTFQFTAPRAPTYAFFSLSWGTPETVKVGDGGKLDTEWDMKPGDGRVPLPEGGSRPDTSKLSEYWPVYSVHGAIPKDSLFQEKFLKGRLPSLVSTMVAYRLITELGSDSDVVSAYAKSGGAVPTAEEFRAGMDGTPRPGEPAVARSLLGREVVKSANDFGSRLCATTPLCATTYAAAKEMSTDAVAAIQAFGKAAGNSASSVQDKAAASAQLGIANLKLGNMSAAGHVLSKASVDLDKSIALPSTTNSGKRALGDFKLVVDRNLATALRESGQCVAAKAALESVLESTSKFRGDLKAKCYDRDSAVYQALDEF